MFFCLNCEKEYPNKWIIDGKTLYIYNNVDADGKRKKPYCYTCRPPGSSDRQKLQLKKRMCKTCSKCKLTKDSTEFRIRKYKNKSGDYLTCLTSECRLCENTKALTRVRESKKLCVEYKGGKCECCGYDKNISALDFHHKDRNGKLFNVSDKKHLKIDDLKSELDKCELLCANCHREKEYPL